MADREWTGSVSVLPQSMRELALEFDRKAHEHGTSPLSSYLVDHASTLIEWADAIEQLYARLDEGDTVTNAQGVALARFLRGHFMRDRFSNATVCRGGAGLPDDFLYVRFSDGYEGGIAPNGDTST